MVGDALSGVGAAGRTGRLGIAAPLLLAAITGTSGALLLWVTRGWRDGMACYAVAVVVVGLILMWRTNWQPTVSAGAAQTATPGGPADPSQATRIR